MEEESLQSPARKLRRKGGVQEFLDKHMGKPIDIFPKTNCQQTLYSTQNEVTSTGK